MKGLKFLTMMLHCQIGGIGLVKGNTEVYIKKELIEAVYVPPVLGTDAVEILEDGFDMNITRDEIERNTLSNTIESEASRVGLKQVAGAIPVEYKASSVLGDEPREGKLFESLLGGLRQITTETISETGNTTTKIYVADADALKYKKHDILLAKIMNGLVPAWQVRPVLLVDLTPGSCFVEFAIPFMNVPQDGCVIGEMSLYYHKEGAPTLSLTRYIGGKIRENIAGLRCISGSLEGWEAGKTSSWNFAVEAVDGKRIEDFGGSGIVPSFDSDSLPPVMIEACVWLNGVETDYSEMSMSLENTKTDLLSACAPSGKIGSRFTQFMASMEINPYMEDDDIERFKKFEANGDVSVFGYAYNPKEDGTIGGIVAFWLPQNKITQIPSADIDGIVTDAISLKSYRKDGNDTIFLGFI